MIERHDRVGQQAEERGEVCVGDEGTAYGMRLDGSQIMLDAAMHGLKAAPLPGDLRGTLDECCIQVGRLGDPQLANAPAMEDLGGPFWTAWAQGTPVAAVWAERTWAPDERLAVRAGARLEGGEKVEGAGALRLAPRLGVRYTASPEVGLSAGYARVGQHTQSLAPGGVHLASLVSGDVWLVAGPDIPALRSDIVTVGMEAWLEPGRVVSLNGFGRRTAGVAMLDPRPGPVFGRTEHNLSSKDRAEAHSADGDSTMTSLCSELAMKHFSWAS